MRTVAACFVLAAVIATPGIVVAATSSASGNHQTFNVSSGPTVIGSGTLRQVTPPSSAVKSVEDSLIRAFATKGVDLRFLPVSRDTFEAFQSGTGRCLVDIAVSDRSRTPRPFFLSPECGSRTTRANVVGVTYSPPSERLTVERALATLPG